MDDELKSEPHATPRPSIVNNFDGLNSVSTVDDEEAQMNLLKTPLKHLFILSDNGKRVFTRYESLGIQTSRTIHLLLDMEMRIFW